MIVTRFAPSPTGRLHLGHALSAWLAWQLARQHDGHFLLRMEDIDTTRCRPEFADAIMADLRWLGLDWDGPVWRQADRAAAYQAALAQLVALGVAYPCFCTRADIAAAASAPHGPVAAGVYPGTCRQLPADLRRHRLASEPAAWRLDVAAALAHTGPLHWHDAGAGWQQVAVAEGDFVVARRDIGTAYMLAVVVDDAAQGVTDVVRGADLFSASHGQRLLQALLGLPVPRYHHHALLLDGNGQRLAKRHGSETLASRRAAGASPADVFASLGKQAAAPYGQQGSAC